ncbi:CLUMA_CG008465, isoform A [Clunio marinus]|uniref:CLUMA_CG008465, isoform A n=1 Tax=Clunio marinus TaxID=568069 RepID=A0A1J1I969_9DIPT|nr:CLUMA_CG008465, isoform A [Clunio marinus]
MSSQSTSAWRYDGIILIKYVTKCFRYHIHNVIIFNKKKQLKTDLFNIFIHDFEFPFAQNPFNKTSWNRNAIKWQEFFLNKY